MKALGTRNLRQTFDHLHLLTKSTAETLINEQYMYELILELLKQTFETRWVFMGMENYNGVELLNANFVAVRGSFAAGADSLIKTAL